MKVLTRRLPPSEFVTGQLQCGAAVHVPFPPKGHCPDTIAACERVLVAGIMPESHLPARSVRSPDKLGDRLSALEGTGVDSPILVAGDRAAYGSPYPDTPALLGSGPLADHGLRRSGVPSHSETDPLLGPADLDCSASAQGGIRPGDGFGALGDNAVCVLAAPALA